MKQIGVKGNNINPGYVFAPYIEVMNLESVVVGNFSPKQSMSNRYSQPLKSKKETFIEKLKNRKKLL